MSFAGKYMELETIILNKINQTNKNKDHVFSHMQTQSRSKKTSEQTDRKI
jgi:hypothetical protein